MYLNFEYPDVIIMITCTAESTDVLFKLLVYNVLVYMGKQ